MARKSGPTISQEELYPSADEPRRHDTQDARLLDLDVEQEAPFLRVQKRVPARRGSLPKKTLTRLTWAALALSVAVICGMGVAALYHYGERSWRFRVESSDDIDISGLQNVTRAQIMEVMGGDIGRNIFFVPLAQRKSQLEQIPWVESASVMRFVPNRLQVEIHERTPVAFARVGSKIQLVDAAGTLMELPNRKKYSFPVILGMNSGEPSSTRAARMRIFNELGRQLDAGGGRYSQELSEIDLSDPDDVKVMANNHSGDVLVHLGSANYLERYRIYVTHVQEWQQQFDKLESVDLRYDRQIIVNPDLQGPAKQLPLSGDAAKKAMAAGVKKAALVTRMSTSTRPTPMPVNRVVGPPVAKPVPFKVAAAPKVPKPTAHHKARVRKGKASARNSTRAKTGAGKIAKTKTSPDAIAVVKPAAKPSPAIGKGEPQ
jgi:cell division protein FtsQ